MTNPPPPNLTAAAAQALEKLLAELGPTLDAGALEAVLRMTAKWRSAMLANTYIAHHGPTIMAGPFAGMTYVKRSTEGALIARLLGCYEADLHPHMAAMVDEGLDCIVDVGCAEGYYAVGLARKYPALEVHARDTSEAARAACAELARENGVTERVIIGGEFAPRDFEAFAGRRALVLVDAEGAELDILRPDLSPALAGMKLIVETHDVFREGALATLVERFSPTHDIVRVDQTLQGVELPTWLKNLSHLDQVLATWEWRIRPTPWLVMRPRSA